MRNFKPPKQLNELGLVLQYDSWLQDCSKSPIFKTHERFIINQRRSQILSESITELLPFELEQKIIEILFNIELENWKPKKKIEFKLKQH